MRGTYRCPLAASFLLGLYFTAPTEHSQTCFFRTSGRMGIEPHRPSADRRRTGSPLQCMHAEPRPKQVHKQPLNGDQKTELHPADSRAPRKRPEQSSFT